MGNLKGTFPALLTPYDVHRNIDEKEFVRYCEFGISKGLDGLFCNGSAGDSQALSLEKQVKLMQLSKSVAKNNVPVITGITSTVYEHTLILAQKAYELNLDALLLAMPYYYKLDENDLFEYVRLVANSAKIPVYVYNIPLFAPSMSLKLIEKVSKLDNVVGIKDSSGDALLLNHILDVVPCDFDVFVGREEFYAGALFAGAKGSMTSIGGVFPELMSEIYHCMCDKNYEKALGIQKSLLKAIRFAMSISFPMGFALLLKLRGFEFTRFRIHPSSIKAESYLEQFYNEAKNVIQTLEQETGILL
ncbi:dihydrodipicolinate synthase family protein [Campylobacter sp. 2014D-0216]|uniref:dihydrodipicolinate synthase family protein n=1 Tax=Campylobacter sp. 2014D-0216 TaxID=1813595 RepID=UPI0018A60AEE|nr:dihydrodipicolinate synthase family protein [Campylobacter sp. 2014D-0216]QOR01620.1 dihydrodipicolinate synthase family protein [Campylobacter sp. 2014D-0216]